MTLTILLVFGAFAVGALLGERIVSAAYMHRSR
ncbi:MAG: hypothetical protein FD177_242 [Desulfovibrionaceae bacterium]|nr:MAG: hypothetical protein FD177_242 [Desulfovibrionaceae bacterium]